MEPYVAVCVQAKVADAKNKRDVMANVQRVCDWINSAVWVNSMEGPVKLVAFPEGCLQGFPDEGADAIKVGDYLDNVALDVEGEETDRVGEVAKSNKTYVAIQSRVKLPEFKNCYFNAAILIGPNGKVVYTSYKHAVYPAEPSATPHDVYDQWCEVYGNSLDSFFPVAKTEIGNIAGVICFERDFPESARGYALNGAEILYMPSGLEPRVSRGTWEIQNRARALDNTCYVIAPNCGPLYSDVSLKSPKPGFVCGGRSMIVNYLGEVLAVTYDTQETFIAAPINLQSLRSHRCTAGRFNPLPYLRTEIYRKVYEQPVYPANRCPQSRMEREQILKESVKSLIRRGVLAAPDYL